ncbi:MAG TPA: hypothetical protein GXX46_11225 [Peptococcaceae bacterium]|nr:hypothetical protein [Peptococcaceae bacterium]
MKKSIGVFLVVLFCTLALVACSSGPKDLTKGKTPEKIVEESFAKWYELDSYDLDLNSQIKMSLGQQVMDMSMTGTISAFQNPLKMKMVMDVAIPGMNEKVAMEQYMVEEEQKVIIYQQVQGMWQKMTIDDPAMLELMSMDPRENLKLFMDNLTEAEILGEETIGDKVTVKIKIVASGKIFEDIFQDMAGTSLGISDDIFDTELLSQLGDMEYLIWIEKSTLETVKCQMDLTETMRNLGSALAAKISEPEMAELQELFSTMEMSLEYTVFNQNNVQDFTIPEEAKNAQEITLPSTGA